MPRASSRSSRIAASRSSDAVVEQLAGGLRVAVEPGAGRAERDGERDELLLRAVVQVALDPPAGDVAALHDPRARRPQLLHAGAQVSLQPLVLERERRGAADGAEARAVLGRRRVVDEHRHRLPVLLDRRAARAPPGSGSMTGAPTASTHSRRSGRQ